MQLGAKLKRVRENKQISQQEIADLLGISQKTYSNIESDKSTPSIVQLSKLSEHLEFDLLELLKENGVVFNQKNEKGINNGIVHNNIPNKLITQYEARLQEKDEIINLLKEKITWLEK